MNLLEVKNICKTYGNGETAVKALKDVSFSVPKGEYVAIVGESGSGKSTLLNMIGALDTPTSGKVLIDGKDIFSMNDKKLTVFRRRNIGFIFQAFNLVPELTVEQNIIFLLLLIGAGPIIHYGSLSLVYRFLAAIAQPISDKRVVGALSTMGEGCAMLLKLLLTAEVLCMLTFLIVVVSVS